MSRYKDSNKYKIYGEDAILAARFDKYLDATLRNCRADYLKALSKRKQREIPYEDLPDAEKEVIAKMTARFTILMAMTNRVLKDFFDL